MNSTEKFIMCREDDFQALEGIGPITEMALKKIGIKQFNDLATFTPEALSRALLDQAEVTIPAKSIANWQWIAHARKLARPRPNLPDPISENDRKRQFIAEDIMKNEDQTQNNEKANSSEKATTPEREPVNSSGVASEQPEPLPLQEKKDGDENARQDPKSTKLKDQPIENQQKGPALQKTSRKKQKQEQKASVQIRSAHFKIIETRDLESKLIVKNLFADIHFKLLNFANRLQTQKAPYCVQIHGIDKTSGRAELLANLSRDLQREQVEYHAKLEFPAPKAGHYELRVAVLLLFNEGMINLYPGPNLRVER